MPKIFTLNNPNFKSPNECSDISPVPADLRDRPSAFCEDKVFDPCHEIGRKKKFGERADCDPMQTGQIVNDLTKPTRNVIYRYSKALRGCDEAMQDLFNRLVVIDEDGKPWPVPILWGTQEKAVAWVLAHHAKKDNTLVVDRPPLPLMAIHSATINFSRDRYIYHKAQTFYQDTTKPLHVTELKDRDTVFGIARGIPIDIGYTLYAWTYYVEDMNQIVEQILLKFSPMAYIKVQGVPWEIGINLDATGNNTDFEPGDKNERIIKYQFDMTVQTFVPQPITRARTVLNIKTDFHNSVEASSVDEVMGREEVGVND